VHEVLAHRLVAQLEQRGACERRGGLKLFVGVRAGVEVDADDACVPAAFATVDRCDLLDEAVLGERAQVVAAGRRALSDFRGALGRGRITVELEPREDPQAGRVPERAKRVG
jgi:hypothetical protein